MKLTIPQMVLLGHAGHCNYEKTKSKVDKEPNQPQDDGKWEKIKNDDAAAMRYVMGY